jgi:hypothetical protein
MEKSLPRIAEDVHQVIEWPVEDLHRTARFLMGEKLHPVLDQAGEANRLLGHVAFEMWSRRQEKVKS